MSEIADLLKARYGSPVADILQTNDPVIGALLRHRSVRAYLPDPLEPGVLELLIAAAQSASTSSNLQAWSVVAVEDADTKQRLAAYSGHQKHIVEAPLFLAWIVDLHRLRNVAHGENTSSEGLDFLETFLIGVIDATLAAQNLVLAAESLGLGVVYIGGLRNHPEKVEYELHLPALTFPIFGLVVGKPDPSRPSAIKPRLPQAAVLHRERYQTEPQQQSVSQYDRVMSEFYAEQKLPQQRWTTHTANRIKAPESLGSRTRLLEAITNLGFKIK